MTSAGDRPDDESDTTVDLDDRADDRADVAGDSRRAGDGARPTPAGEPASWPVVLVRASGLLLVGLAAWRFAADALVTPPGEVDSFTVERRLDDTAWRLAEWAFLVLAVVHGAVGTHWALRRRIRWRDLRSAVEAVAATFVLVLFAAASLVLLAG